MSDWIQRSTFISTPDVPVIRLLILICNTIKFLFSNWLSLTVLLSMIIDFEYVNREQCFSDNTCDFKVYFNKDIKYRLSMFVPFEYFSILFKNIK